MSEEEQDLNRKPKYLLVQFEAWQLDMLEQVAKYTNQDPRMLVKDSALLFAEKVLEKADAHREFLINKEKKEQENGSD